MDRCTHEVRAQYWKGIMQAGQQRPKGQSVRQWLKDNGILEQSYYKWQQKLAKPSLIFSLAISYIFKLGKFVPISL